MTAGRSLTLALAALGAGRARAARPHLVRAIEEGGADAVVASQELVQTFLRASDGVSAEPLLRSLLPPRSAALSHALGYLCRRTGRPREARRHLRAALRRAPGLVPASIELGWLLCTTGRASEGRPLLERAERGARRAGDGWSQASAISCLATDALVRFELRRALLLLPRAVELKRKAGDRLGLGRALNNLALAHYYLADYARALTLYREALEVQHRIGDREPAGRTWNNLAGCYVELADPRRAAEAFRKALAAARRAGDLRATGVALGNLAVVRAELGDPAAAERLYRASLSVLASAPDPDLFCNTVQLLMRTQSLGGRPERALATFRRLPARLARQASVRTLVSLAKEETRARLALGHLAAASAALARTQALVRRIPGPGRALALDVLDVETLAGRLALARGRPAEAERRLARTALSLADLSRVFGGASLRMGLFEAQRDLVAARMAAALARGDAGRAFALGSAAKARLLRESRGRRSAPGGYRLRDEIEAEIRAIATSRDAGPATAARLRLLRRRYLNELERDREGGTSAAVHLEAPAGSGELGPSTALLDYHLGADESSVFVVHGGAIELVRLAPSEARLASAVERLLRPLRAARSGVDAWAELDGFDLALAHRLYHWLVEPALSRMPAGAKRLVIVPDGALHELPFELLVVSPPDDEEAGPRRRRVAGGAGGPGGIGSGATGPLGSEKGPGRFERARYLGDERVISYTQSASLLAASPRRPSRVPTSFLGLAHSPAPGAVLHGPLGRLPVPSLPGVLAEVRSLARLFPNARVKTGRAASVHEYERRAGAAEVIHLAAHAYTDAIAPGLSGIVVGAPATGALDLLSAERISRVPLRAPLVSLSACDTGGGRRFGREGMLGLVRAFFEAGATAVVASFWPVDDRAARDLMRAFYARLLAGEDRAAALAAARRSLKRAGGGAAFRAHPFFWASFVLFDHAPDARPARGRESGQ